MNGGNINYNAMKYIISSKVNTRLVCTVDENYHSRIYDRDA